MPVIVCDTRDVYPWQPNGRCNGRGVTPAERLRAQRSTDSFYRHTSWCNLCTYFQRDDVRERALLFPDHYHQHFASAQNICN